MILTIDMGNTNIKVGFVKRDGESSRIIEERLATDHGRTAMNYASDMMAMLAIHKVSAAEIEGGIISSVVSDLTDVIKDAVVKVFGFEPLIVNGSMKMDVDFSSMAEPESVAADFICGAEGAYSSVIEPVILVNMGTATTITIVDGDGHYLGGVILPGIRTSLKALFGNTTMLPDIDLGKPGRAIAKDTIEALTSGIIYSNAGMVDAIIDRMNEEFGAECRVLATGGLAGYVVPYCRHEITLDGELLLKGLLELYELNKDGAADTGASGRNMNAVTENAEGGSAEDVSFSIKSAKAAAIF